MTAPSPALRAQLRPVIGAQWINLGLCLSLLSVAFALRDSISPAVWVRSTIILIVGLLMLWCGKEMRRGRRWAYVRAKWIAVLGTIGFVGVAALPGPFPAWMRIEQGAQALVFLALTWMLTRPALALFFPRVNARMIHTEKPIPLSDASGRDFTILPAPIVDPQRWAGFDLLVIFNDTFFMALMFLLSGLFVWPSLERKGGARFLRDRVLRLGVPFAVAAGILMPLAYYPSYAVTGADPGFLAYSSAWLSLGSWPSGPAWFIWLLFVFDAVAAGLHELRRRWRANTRAPRYLGADGRPPAFVAVLLVISALVYVPMELVFGADSWVTLGAFSFQASRLLLYATFFLVGIQMGAVGTQSGILARNAGLARRWPIWLSAGLAAYALRLAVIIALILPVAAAHRPLPLTLRLLSDLTLVLCCGTISFAQFLRHVSHSLPRRRLAPVRATRGRAKPNNQGRHRLRRRGRPELGNSGGTPPRSGDRACTLIDASVGTFASRRAQGPDIAADVAF